MCPSFLLSGQVHFQIKGCHASFYFISLFVSYIFTFFFLMQTVKALIRPHILGHHICFVNHRLQCCNILVSSNQALLFSQSFRINKMLQKDLNNAIFKCFQNDMIGKVKKYVSVHMKIAYWDEEPLFCAWQSCIHSHLVISKYPSLFTEGQRRFYAHFLGVHFWV